MIDRQNDRLEGALVDAVAAMRNQSVPIEPSEALMRQTIERLRAGASRMQITKRGPWWTARRVKTTAWATAVAAVAMVVFAWFVWGFGAAHAFADVVQQVNAATAVRCRLIVGRPDGAGKDVEGKEIMDALVVPARGLILYRAGDGKLVFNPKAGMVLGLHTESKNAYVSTFAERNQPELPQMLLEIFEGFKQMDGGVAKALGEKEINGKKTNGFEVTHGGTEMTIWADPATNLPVSIEVLTGKAPAKGRWTFSDFDWNPKVDAEELSELSLEIPDGYWVTLFPGFTADEKSVQGMLRRSAELSDGKFPDELSLQAFRQISGNYLDQLAKKEGPSSAEATQEHFTRIMEPLAGGIDVMSNSAIGGDWVYGGKGAKLGQKGRAVLWYKPAGGAGWRVIDANLTVHDAKEEPAGGKAVNVQDVGAGTKPAAALVP